MHQRQTDAHRRTGVTFLKKKKQMSWTKRRGRTKKTQKENVGTASLPQLV